MKKDAYFKKTEQIRKDAALKSLKPEAQKTVRAGLSSGDTVFEDNKYGGEFIKYPFKTGPNFNPKTKETKVSGIGIKTMPKAKSGDKFYSDKKKKPSNGIGVGM